MSLTKNDLISNLYNQKGLSRSKSTAVVEFIFEKMKKTLGSGDDVLFSGFGKFSVKNKNQRKGRNPATGEDMMLGARRIVTFRCAGMLRDKINRKE